MTGPEHYREAEEAIRASTWQRQEAGDERNAGMSSAIMVGSLWEMFRALTHATLASAAATAMAGPSANLPAPDWDAWRSVAATPAESSTDQ